MVVGTITHRATNGPGETHVVLIIYDTLVNVLCPLNCEICLYRPVNKYFKFYGCHVIHFSVGLGIDVVLSRRVSQLSVDLGIDVVLYRRVSCRSFFVLSLLDVKLVPLTLWLNLFHQIAIVVDQQEGYPGEHL
jgi:hypothetical protein